MIVAKTNLKKIPESCNKCKFSTFTFYNKRCCILLSKYCKKVKAKSGNWMYTRLKECPLIEHLEVNTK